MVSPLTTSSFLGEERSDMRCISLDRYTLAHTMEKGSILGRTGSQITLIKRQECVEALLRSLQPYDL